MTTALIWILTPILVIDCLLLGLLVVVQLPKKEAGVGMAFGGGASDALFGAGSGTALTKLTKYCAGIFFALVLVLCILNIRALPQRASASELSRQLSKPVPSQPMTQPSVPAEAPAASNEPMFQGLTNSSPTGAATAPAASNSTAAPSK